MKKQPAQVSYFFEQGYKDLWNTIRDSWKANLESASDSFENASYAGWIKRLFWWGAGISVVVFGTVWFLVLSLIHILILFIVFLTIYFLFTFVWIIDYLFRFKEQVFAPCPLPGCHKKSPLPVYWCPQCNREHTQLWPSKYGIFKRTCECGEKLPCTFFNKRGKLRATCPHCGGSINTEEGTPLIIPIIGPPNAGKSTYLYSMLSILIEEFTAKGYKVRSNINDKLIKESIRRLASSGFVDKTVAYDETAIDILISKGSTKYVIYFYDVAGEAFNLSRNIEKHRFYGYFSAMMFLLDPFAVEQVRTEYYESFRKHLNKLPSGNNHLYDKALGLNEVYATLTLNLAQNYNIKDSDSIKQLLAVIIPKTDLLDDKTDMTDKECRDFLTRFGQKSFIEQIIWKFKNVRFFGVSSTGKNSIGILAPFEWILTKEMKRKSVRRFFGNLLMTFFIVVVAGMLGTGTFYLYKTISGIKWNQNQVEIIEHVDETVLKHTYYCNATILNVRDQPNIKGKIIGQLKKNQECNVSSYDPESKFATIDFNGTTAYVSAEYLKPKDASNKNNLIPAFPDNTSANTSANTSTDSSTNSSTNTPTGTPTDSSTSESGYVISQDEVKLVEQLYREAEQGDAKAQISIGDIYYNGFYGISEDRTKAFEWYLKAAEQGDAVAQRNLGIMYEYGTGVSEDYAMAAEWYCKAAEQGDNEVQYILGMMYYDGRGVSKDYTKAVEWYRKAAEQGYAAAQNSLGYMYTNGFGVSRDYTKAAEWFLKAAEQGNATAQNNLGYMYETGQGVSKDYTKAAEWYRKAAELGNENAKQNLTELREKGYIQ
jgi:TPR repeat protein